LASTKRKQKPPNDDGRPEKTSGKNTGFRGPSTGKGVEKKRDLPTGQPINAQFRTQADVIGRRCELINLG